MENNNNKSEAMYILQPILESFTPSPGQPFYTILIPTVMINAFIKTNIYFISFFVSNSTPCFVLNNNK